MYSDIAARFQPINEHLQSILRKLIPGPRALCIVIAKIARSMIFVNAPDHTLMLKEDLKS
jgi:hypothetical protein